MSNITPVRIQQIVNKKPRDPVSASDWNDILNMLIEQQNLLSDQLVGLQSTIEATTTQVINNLIASGTLTLNVDATKLGGLLANAYAKTADITALNTAIASTYATVTALNAAKQNITDLQTAMTAAQTDINNLKTQTAVNTSSVEGALTLSTVAPTATLAVGKLYGVY
jgi:expansin (peptidoglycan-binding protein)